MVLGATYLYNNAPEDQKLRPPQIKIPESEKRSQQGYFDIESIATPARSPLRTPSGEALSTSRPSTPVFERLPRMKSTELRMSKRDH